MRFNEIVDINWLICKQQYAKKSKMLWSFYSYVINVSFYYSLTCNPV